MQTQGDPSEAKLKNKNKKKNEQSYQQLLGPVGWG